MQTSEIKYTKEQTLALMKDRHLAVTANAGSGKTSVLVEKYLDLLISNKPQRAYDAIRSIVAITFTRQAAADMKAKITAKISKRMLEDPFNLKEWKSLREQISSAKVTTIHSFCNGLLRDYPVEAGISPIFREMDEYESNYYAEISVDGLIEQYSDAMLNSEFSEFPEEKVFLFQNLLNSLGIQQLRGMLLAVVREPVTLRSWLEFYSKPVDEIFEYYKDEFERSIRRDCEQLADIFSDNIDNIPPESKSYRAICDGINEISAIVRDDNYELTNFIGKLKEFHELKIKGNAKATNYLIDCHFGKGTEDSKSFRGKVTELAGMNFDLLNGNDNSQTYIELVKIFVNFADEANNIFGDIKNEQSAYTFDDLLIMALNLLRQPEVRDKIIADMQYLMVDEFQDTNQIQYDMVKFLVPGLMDNSYKGGPKVFIVGDAKQSIYGFRSADVTVFNTAKEDIRKFNENAIVKKKINHAPKIFGQYQDVTDSQAFGDISLADTFRLLPAIALFTNSICRNIFDESKSGIAYEPLVCGRKLIKNVENNLGITPENGTVNFLIAIKKSKKKEDGELIPEIENDEEIDSENISEAELVSRFIQKIVAGETDIKIFDGTEYVAPKYSDIAILTRKKGSIQKLSKIFIEKKINFAVVSGKGFYQTQEVIDFISLLNFLVNHNDEISLAGTLKSPLFNINDGELLNIAQQKGTIFFEKFQNYKSENEESAYFIQRAKDIISDLISQSSLVSISELILRTIEITDYYGAIEQFDAKEQIKSNINMLVQSAREFESKGYKSLYEFIQRANALSEASSEAEAAFVSDDNVISIMTTHASKGLEFPVVILFDSNSKGTGDKGLVKSKNFGITIPINLPEPIQNSEKFYMQAADTMVQRVIKRVKSDDDLAEEARLLYVAMTRAKDHLIISATISETKDSFSFYKDSFFGLLINSLQIPIERFAFGDKFVIIDKLKFTGKEELNLNLDINVIIKTDNISSNNNEQIGKFQSKYNLEREYFSKEILPSNRFDIVSATKYTTFLTDFDSFSNRYVLGLPDTKNNDFTEIQIRDDEVNNLENSDYFKADGSAYGTIIHRILERINEWLSDACENNFQKLKSIINQTLFENYFTDNKSMFDRAFKESIAISKSRIIRDNNDNFKCSEFEKELNMPFEGSILTGNIDLLLKNSDESTIEVWDWKSNTISKQLDYIELCEHYKPQIELYLYLVSKLYPELKSYTGRLLFTMLSDTQDWTFNITMSRDDIQTFENKLKSSVKEIKEY